MLVQELIHNSLKYIQKHHLSEMESDAYCAIVKRFSC